MNIRRSTGEELKLTDIHEDLLVAVKVKYECEDGINIKEYIGWIADIYDGDIGLSRCYIDNMKYIDIKYLQIKSVTDIIVY
jgi:hypothetical protein